MLYGWSQTGALEGDNSTIDENATAFVVIEEKTVPSKNSSLEPLLKGLEMWKYNEDENEVLFKFDTLLPTSKSKVMVVYDRGFESFERRADVFSVNNFPYDYYVEDQPLISVYDADSDGTVYLEYEGKRIKLAPNDTYRTAELKGFKLSFISIHNHGLLQKEQFKSLYKPSELYQDVLTRLPSLTDEEKQTLKKQTENILPANTHANTKEKEALIAKAMKPYLKE